MMTNNSRPERMTGKQSNTFPAQRRTGTRKIKFSKSFEFNDIIAHFSEDLTVTRDLSRLADELDGKGESDRAKILRYTQMARLSSMLDFYLHELCKLILTRMFQGRWDRSKQYEKRFYSFSLPELEEIIVPDKDWDSDQTFRNCISKKEHFISYIAPKDIKDLLELLSIQYTDVCKGAGYSEDKSDKFLYDMSKNRNTIVHQTGRQARNAEYIDITPECLADSTDFLEKFVNAIHEIAEGIDSEPESE